MEQAVYQNGKVAFTRGDFEKLARKFRLGEVTDLPRLEEGGNVNYNFALQTQRGIFMVRAKKQKTSPELVERKSREYEITDFLNREDFEYEVPQFLFDDNGNRLISEEDRTFEVYKRLSGISGSSENPITLQEIVKALAKYHNAIADFPKQITDSPRVYDEQKRLKNRIDSIVDEVQNPKDQIERLVKENADFLIETYKLLDNFSPRPHTLFTHNDFHRGNLLHSNGTITGIIDFGNIASGSKSKDLSKIAGDKKKIEDLAYEYRKHSDLSDEDIEGIIPERILGQLQGICWIYRGGMEKRDSEKERILNKRIKQLRKLVAEIE